MIGRPSMEVQIAARGPTTNEAEPGRFTDLIVGLLIGELLLSLELVSLLCPSGEMQSAALQKHAARGTPDAKQRHLPFVCVFQVDLFDGHVDNVVR
jgi:hypothetical protein